jgi:oxalate decarboxylase/phosphoglucose isomerase-like protein (cupin superfamily)
MFLNSVRTNEELSQVLLNPQSKGPDPVYLVFSGLGDVDWENITVISNGFLDKEYPKTFGHYHPPDSPTETYKVLYGEGIFLLQEKFMENGAWVKNKVKNVIAIKATKNESIVISTKWGHSSSNFGKSPLVTLDDWRKGHSPDDYEPVKQLKGMAYYMTEENGQFTFVKNPNYSDVPKPLVMTAEEFANYERKNI